MCLNLRTCHDLKERPVTSNPRHKVPIISRHPNDGWVLADPYPMSGPTRRALRGLIRVLCPPAPGPTLPDLEDRIEIHVRRMLQYMVPIVALGFVLGLYLLDFAPLWRFRAASRIQKLEREQAESVLTEMGESRSPFIRMLILGVRGLVLSTFYDQDEAHAAMDFHPIPFIENRIELRERILAGGAPTEEDRILPLPKAAE